MDHRFADAGRGPVGPQFGHAPRGPEGDAVSALVHLGYSDARAAEAVARAVQAVGEHSEASALIREALKGMAR